MDKKEFFLRIVTAHKGGTFSSAGDISFRSKRSAVDECERLQFEFDNDCEPKRAYVLDKDKVPIYAGAQKVAEHA